MTGHALDPAGSELRVWTYKEGLLSRVAHDLRLRATRLEGSARIDGDRVACEVAVPVAGLRVEGQVARGAVVPLGEKDHREIEGNLRSPRVLDAAAHPDVRFRGEGRREGGRLGLSGELTIRGAARPLAVDVTLEPAGGDALRARGEVRLRQTDWGIEPYRALLGALKVQDGVRITFDLRIVPAGAAPAGPVAENPPGS